VRNEPAVICRLIAVVRIGDYTKGRIKMKWNDVEDLLPDDTDDVEVIIGENGNSMYGDSLRRIAWFDGDWRIHSGKQVSVEKWRELKD
jgi:hypothetical protein